MNMGGILGLMLLHSIIWLITGKCNLNCRYCYASRFRGLTELNTSECLRIIDEAGELEVDHISFTGGEPFLRKDIFDLFAEARNLGIYVTVVTNGSIMDEDKARRLSRLGVFVYLSVDGVRESHEEVRGEGSWRFVEKAVNLFKKFGVEFATVTALNKRNYVEVEKLLRFSVDSGASYHCFIPVMPFGRAGWQNVLDKKQVLEFFRILEDSLGRVDATVDLWCMPFAERFIGSPSNVYVNVCRGMGAIDISVNGDILLCDVLDVVLDNVKGKSLKEVWVKCENHELVKNILNPKLDEPCNLCPVKSKCLGGCYARSYAKYGDFNKPDPLCPAVTDNV